MQSLRIIDHLRYVVALTVTDESVMIKTVVQQSQGRGLPAMERVLFSPGLEEQDGEEQNRHEDQCEGKSEPLPIHMHTRVLSADRSRHGKAVVGIAVLTNVHGQRVGNAVEDTAEVLELACLVGEDETGVVEDGVVDGLGDARGSGWKVLSRLRLGHVAVEV
jgi:hypothetical protein